MNDLAWSTFDREQLDDLVADIEDRTEDEMPELWARARRVGMLGYWATDAYYDDEDWTQLDDVEAYASDHAKHIVDDALAERGMLSEAKDPDRVYLLSAGVWPVWRKKFRDWIDTAEARLYRVPTMIVDVVVAAHPEAPDEQVVETAEWQNVIYYAQQAATDVPVELASEHIYLWTQPGPVYWADLRAYPSEKCHKLFGDDGDVDDKPDARAEEVQAAYAHLNRLERAASKEIVTTDIVRHLLQSDDHERREVAQRLIAYTDTEQGQ